MKIDTLLFDIGDVLIDIDWNRGFNKMLGQMKNAEGIDLNLQEISDRLHPGPYASVFDDFGMGKTTRSEFLNICAEKTRYTGDMTLLEQSLTCVFEPLPHRIVLLNELIDSGKYKIALVSDTNEMHMNYIESYIPDIFKNIAQPQRYYSYNLGLKKKLGKEIYEAVLKDMGIAAENALMIDDRVDNKKGADEIGLNFLLIQKDQDLEKILRDAPYHLVF